MIHVVDNFLDITLFDKAREEISTRIPAKMHYEKTSKKNVPIRLGGKISNTKVYNFDVLLGLSAKPIVNVIKKYISENLKFKNAQENWLWYQCTLLETEKVKPHYDGRILNKMPTQCFTSFIYMHEKWEDDWGGELCFKDKEILPKPNRFVIYSRDHLHWVNSILHNIPDYQRMSIGVDWSTDNDF